MRPFQAQTGLKKADDLLKVTTVLVHLDQTLQLLGMYNDVETANLREAELGLLNASSVHLLPDSVGSISTVL